MTAKIITLAIGAFLIGSSTAGEGLADAYRDAPLGIVITNIVYDSYGITVHFDTDLEPPYGVGVYRAMERGLQRLYPIAETVVQGKCAYVPGDFTDATSFVEVMTRTRFRGLDAYRRELNKDEKKSFREYVANHPVLIRPREAEWLLAGDAWAPDNVMGQSHGMELIGDHLWVGFVFSSDPAFSFSIRGTKSEPVYKDVQVIRQITETYWYQPVKGSTSRYDWSLWNTSTNLITGDVSESETKTFSSIYEAHEDGLAYKRRKVVTTTIPTGEVESVMDGFARVPHEFSAASVIADPEQLRRGVGYRIAINDQTGEAVAMRAYSARTDCSQAVYLPRAFRGLFAHDGYRLTMDQDGRVICVPLEDNE